MRLRALATTVLVAVPLALTGLQLSATAAPTITDVRPTTLVEGQPFQVVGKVPPRGRPVVLQRHVGKKWKVVDRKRTGQRGRYSFTTGRRLDGCTYADYRVVAPKHGRQHRVVKAFRERVIKQLATLIAPVDVRPGVAFDLDLYLVPGTKGRPVRLERRTGDRWVAVAARKLTNTGSATFRDVSMPGTSASFRVTAPAWKKLDRVRSKPVPVTARAAEPAPAPAIERIPGDVQPDVESRGILFSRDGRYVAFVSKATNLHAGDVPGTDDLFLTDRETRTTAHVAGVPAGEWLFLDSITDDGRFVVFETKAGSLVPGDTNNETDVFVYDRDLDAVTRESVGTGGVQGDASSSGGVISADGKQIEFSSQAQNFRADHRWGTFIRDRVAGTTTLYDKGGYPGISDDLRHQVSASSPSDDACDLNGEADATVHDLATGTGTRVSISADFPGSARNEDFILRVQSPVMSQDRRYVAYAFTDGSFHTSAYVTDRTTGSTRRIPVSVASTSPAEVSISADGSRVAVRSGPQVAVSDWMRGQLWTYDVSTPDTHVGGPLLTADGSAFAFTSTRTDLVPGDTNGAADVYVAHLG